ncbi:tetracycline resistance protein [Vibrio ponticus]|nr:tetracycline resistance protein [Vibrio ponticus]
MSVSVIALIFTAPIWGSFSDKSGRQRILTLSLFGAGIATIMTGVLLSYIELFTAVTFGYCLLAIRISHGIVSSGLKPVTQATAADVSTPANRLSTMALIGATFGLGSILGAVLLLYLAVNIYCLATF